MSTELFRSTGRTTRMIQEAYEYSWTVGRPVFIFVAHAAQKRQLNVLWLKQEVRQDLIISSNKIEQKYNSYTVNNLSTQLTKRTRLLVAFYTMVESKNFLLGHDISVGQIFVDHFAREQDIK